MREKFELKPEQAKSSETADEQFQGIKGAYDYSPEELKKELAVLPIEGLNAEETLESLEKSKVEFNKIGKEKYEEYLEKIALKAERIPKGDPELVKEINKRKEQGGTILGKFRNLPLKGLNKYLSILVFSATLSVFSPRTAEASESKTEIVEVKPEAEQQIEEIGRITAYFLQGVDDIKKITNTEEYQDKMRELENGAANFIIKGLKEGKIEKNKINIIIKGYASPEFSVKDNLDDYSKNKELAKNRASAVKPSISIENIKKALKDAGVAKEQINKLDIKIESEGEVNFEVLDPFYENLDWQDFIKSFSKNQKDTFEDIDISLESKKPLFEKLNNEQKQETADWLYEKYSHEENGERVFNEGNEEAKKMKEVCEKARKTDVIIETVSEEDRIFGISNKIFAFVDNSSSGEKELQKQKENIIKMQKHFRELNKQKGILEVYISGGEAIPTSENKNEDYLTNQKKIYSVEAEGYINLKDLENTLNAKIDGKSGNLENFAVSTMNKLNSLGSNEGNVTFLISSDEKAMQDLYCDSDSVPESNGLEGRRIDQLFKQIQNINQYFTNVDAANLILDNDRGFTAETKVNRKTTEWKAKNYISGLAKSLGLGIDIIENKTSVEILRDVFNIMKNTDKLKRLEKGGVSTRELTNKLKELADQKTYVTILFLSGENKALIDYNNSEQEINDEIRKLNLSILR